MKTQNIFKEEKDDNTVLKITNIFALLAGTVEHQNEDKFISDIMKSDSYIDITLFERFFLGRLLYKINYGEIYKTQILPWHNMVLDGLTTLGGENYNTSGTDVYGGGVASCLNIINLTAGIYPYSPGFEKIMISPGPGNIENFSLSCFIPQGKIEMEFNKLLTDQVTFLINLPLGVTGYLQWKDKLIPLNSGMNKVEK